MGSSAAFLGSLGEAGIRLCPFLTVGWGRSSQAPLGFVTGLSLPSSPVLTSAIRWRNDGVYSCSCSGWCGFAKAVRKKGSKGCSDCRLPLHFGQTLCPSNCCPGDQHNHFVEFPFLFFNLRCELLFFPPQGKFSQICQGKPTEKAMMGQGQGLVKDQTWQARLVREVRDVGDLHIFPPCTRHPEHHICLSQQY